MKKSLLYLCIPILLLIAGGCKKAACYTCGAYVLSAYRIDTINYNGQIRYDTTGGVQTGGWTFTVCDVNSHYHYGDYSFSSTFKIDTITVCTLNN